MILREVSTVFLVLIILFDFKSVSTESRKEGKTLPTFQNFPSKVGEGAAAEWVAARDMMNKMPSIDVIRLHPADTEVPQEPAVKYAVSTALSMTATPDSFGRDMLYMARLPKEFQMVYVTDARRLSPQLQQTKDFIDWAIKNKDIFMGGN